jgi:hypothetical protein
LQDACFVRLRAEPTSRKLCHKLRDVSRSAGETRSRDTDDGSAPSVDHSCCSAAPLLLLVKLVKLAPLLLLLVLAQLLLWMLCMVASLTGKLQGTGMDPSSSAKSQSSKDCMLLVNRLLLLLLLASGPRLLVDGSSPSLSLLLSSKLLLLPRGRQCRPLLLPVSPPCHMRGCCCWRLPFAARNSCKHQGAAGSSSVSTAMHKTCAASMHMYCAMFLQHLCVHLHNMHALKSFDKRHTPAILRPDQSAAVVHPGPDPGRFPASLAAPLPIQLRRC